MALSEQDERLLSLIASDPEARRELVKHGARLMPDHPVVRQEAGVEKQFETHVKPLQDEIEDLKKKLLAKTNTDEIQSRRASVKGPPFFFNDEQIAELEARMVKDQNMYGSYVEAARYYQYQDMPTHPTSVPTGVTPFGRRTKAEDDWRQRVKDPKNDIWDKNKRKTLMREQWRQGSEELNRRSR
jgi:hypothetical protein